MPSINLERKMYDELTRIGVDPAAFANEATRDRIEVEKRNAHFNSENMIVTFIEGHEKDHLLSPSEPNMKVVETMRPLPPRKKREIAR